MRDKIRNLAMYGLILVIFCKVTEAELVIYEGNRKLEEFHDIELSHSDFDGIKGVILSANPPDACAPIAEPPSYNPLQNWFVLIAGNFCDYETKVIYAELAGYSAAVIYSLRGDNGIQNSYNDYYSNISAVLVRTSTGLIIKENYLYTIDERYTLFIYPNDTFDTISFLSMMVAALAGLIVIIMLSFMNYNYIYIDLRFVKGSQRNVDASVIAWFFIYVRERYLYRFGILLTPNHSTYKWKFILQKYSLLFVTVVLLVIILTIPIGLIKYYQRTQDVDNSRLSTRHLEQLPTTRFKPGDSYETCAICLEDFKNNDLLRILPCCHGYHTNCIDQWLTENRRICPICKKQVVFNGELPETDNHSTIDTRSETTPLLMETGQSSVSGTNYRTLSNNPYQSNVNGMPLNREIPENITTSVDVEINDGGVTENVVTDIISDPPNVHAASRNEILNSGSESS